jgi:hypothetical protein
MSFRKLKVFEKIQPNENYKTVVTIEQSEKNENYFFIEFSDWQKSPTGRQLWKQKSANGFVDFDKKIMSEFGKFLLECAGS